MGAPHQANNPARMAPSEPIAIYANWESELKK